MIRYKSFQNKSFLSSPTVIIVIIAVILLLLKPLMKFLKLFSGLFDGVGDIGTKFSNLIGLSQSENNVHVNALSSDTTSYWNPKFVDNAPSGTLLLTISNTDKIITDIKSCFGYFYDDFPKILSIFKTLKTQSQVSFISKRFSTIEKSDFLLYLMGESYPQDRLSASEIIQIDDYIKKLPKYKI